MTPSTEKGEGAFLKPSSSRYLSQVERRKSIVRALSANLTLTSVIDLGCGDGRISLQFLDSHTNVTLVDTAPRMLTLASHSVPDSYTTQVRLVQCRIAELVDNQRYDLVIAVGVLAHVTDLAGTLKRIATLVSPTGRAVVQLTDAATIPGAVISASSWVTSSRRGYHLNRLTERQVVASLALHGMELVGRLQYSALYGRFGSEHGSNPPHRLTGFARQALDPWGAEKFLMFRLSPSDGPRTGP